MGETAHEPALTSATQAHPTENDPAHEKPMAPSGLAARFLATLRIGLGFIFFWAFIDKLFGLGFGTTASRAWMNGGSPTNQFLSNAEGPFAGFYQSIAGHPVTDALFMMGLALIGLALLSGIGVRVAGYSGALVMLLMYSAALPPGQNPVLDDHIIYGVVLVGLAHLRAGVTWGLGAWWRRQMVVQKYPVLE
jgi:thiosulfate dehydrogenase [quinone] large subunit